MKRNTDDSNPVMIGQTDWYAQAGKILSLKMVLRLS